MEKAGGVLKAQSIINPSENVELKSNVKINNVSRQGLRPSEQYLKNANSNLSQLKKGSSRHKA